jgi:transcription initiation factor TFIIIB Brf1 subunit/transcription initiation factor TFIIB
MSSEITGSAFDFMVMDVLCPECSQTNKEPIRELVVNNSVPCRYCGAIIDLTAKDTRASIAKFAAEAKEIKRL